MRDGVIMDGTAAEHIREAIPVLASYCDALGIRAFAEHQDLAADLADARFKLMASLCDKPLVNLESAINHPCQALADWKTLDDHACAAPRQVRAELGLSPARAAARRAGRDRADGGPARHGRRRAAPAGLSRCRTRSCRARATSRARAAAK